MTQGGSRYSGGQRAGLAGLALIEAAVFAADVAAGDLVRALVSVLMFAVAAVIFSCGSSVRRARRAAPPAGPEKTFAEEVARAVEARRQAQWGAVIEQAYRAQGGTRPPAPRPAWDVSMRMDRDVAWNDVCAYADVTGRAGGVAEGVIRVIPLARQARAPGAVVAWTVIARAQSQGEGIDLLKAALPSLRERTAELAGAREIRYFRLAGGRLVDAATGEAAAPVPAAPRKAEAGACAHPDAEPVDLITGERVAWVCPVCEAGLPADWR